MTTNADDKFLSILQQFATEITGKFSLSSLSFSPEDQLKSPLEKLLKQTGELLQLEINAVTEIRERILSGRPDFGVTVKSLLVGHIELKAPEKKD